MTCYIESDSSNEMQGKYIVWMIGRKFSAIKHKINYNKTNIQC